MIEPVPMRQPMTADAMQEAELLALRADLILVTNAAKQLTIRLEQVLEARGRPVTRATFNRQARRHLTKRQR